MDMYKSMLEIPFKEVEVLKDKNGEEIELGEGKFGKVIKCKLGGQFVAMKQIKYEPGIDDLKKTFKNEVYIVKYLRHHAIIDVIGWTQISNNKIGILLEHMENRSLQLVILKQHKFSNFEKWQLAKKMIQGIEYLHRKKIIHRDIKPLNFLLKDDMKIIKIADFGLAKMTDSTSMSATGLKGTPRFMPPEILKRTKKHSKESDVYSLGLSLFVLFTDSLPYSDFKDEMQLIFHVGSGGKPKIPKDIPKVFRKLIENCIETDPKKRSNPSNLLKYMKKNEKEFISKFPSKLAVKIVTKECCVHFDTAKCFVLPCCSNYVCFECIVNEMKALKKINIKCPSKCGKFLQKEWLLKSNNKSLLKWVFELDVDVKHACNLCETIITDDYKEKNCKKNALKCPGCSEVLCQFCYVKHKVGKDGLCLNKACESNDNPLKMLDVEPEMISFKFDDKIRKIFRCRLCPCCNYYNFMVQSEECKHIDNCSNCGNSFCFVCLRKKVNGRFGCGNPWSYCGLKPKQKELPFKKEDNNEEDESEEEEDNNEEDESEEEEDNNEEDESEEEEDNNEEDESEEEEDNNDEDESEEEGKSDNDSDSDEEE